MIGRPGRRMANTSKSSIPRGWPVIVSLALIATMVFGMIVIELLITRHVASRVDDLIDNTQQSLVLLDDLRSKAQNLSEPNIAPREATRLLEGIAIDARAYDPIATSPGEPEEWRHLQGLLDRLGSTPVAQQATRDQLANEVDASVDRLVSINAKEGREGALTVHEVDHNALVGNAVIGGVTLILVGAVSAVLWRVLARQRQLVADRFAMLDERTHDLEAFAGRAAHDLRSPMNPIRGYTDLILENPTAADEVTMMAGRIRKAVDRMVRVVDDMLALSTAGHPSSGTSAPSAVVATVLEEMAAELSGVEVITKLDSGDINCSSSLLQQILRNLLGNAVKFRSRTRPLSVTIESHDIGARVEIAVADNGVGMDAETAAHAFEPLYRGRSDRELPGHGLGLAIVDRVARSLGGTCQASSVPDQGTRITVQLPHA